MIEARVDQLQRNRGHAEHVLDDLSGSRVGPRAKSDPEQAARLVPHAVASAFEDEIGRQRSHGIDEASPLQRAEGGFEMGFLALSFRVPEACQQRDTVENDGGIGGKDQIGDPGRRWNQIDLAPRSISVRQSAAHSTRDAAASTRSLRTQLSGSIHGLIL